MTRRAPDLVPVPTSLLDWPDMQTVQKTTFLWLWIHGGCKPGVIQFKLMDLATGTGRNESRQVREKYLSRLEELQLMTVISQTRTMVTAEIFDPDVVALDVYLETKRKKKKMQVPEALLSYEGLSHEAKLSWMVIWNDHGRQEGPVQLRLRDLAYAIGRKQDRGAQRWYEHLQEHGFCRELDNRRGLRTVFVEDPAEVPARREKRLLEEAKRKKKKAG